MLGGGLPNSNRPASNSIAKWKFNLTNLMIQVRHFVYFKRTAPVRQGSLAFTKQATVELSTCV